MARGASFAGTCLTQTAIFKNASEKWRCEQSDSFYQNFVLGATRQIARGVANHICKKDCATSPGYRTSESQDESPLLSGVAS
jgi:hypothetical protein